MRSVGSICVFGGCDLVGTLSRTSRWQELIEHLAVRIQNRQARGTPTLFGAQGNHRVDTRRATRGDEAGNE